MSRQGVDEVTKMGRYVYDHSSSNSSVCCCYMYDSIICSEENNRAGGSITSSSSICGTGDHWKMHDDDQLSFGGSFIS